MKVYRFLILCILCSFALQAFSQFGKIAEIDVQASFFTTDYKGNIYYIDHDSLVKLVPPYHHFYSFRFGKKEMPDFIDVSNPAQVLCLVRNTQKFFLLDSTMNLLLRPFYLDELGMHDIFAAVSSSDMGIWFYDMYTNSLVKLNKNFMPIVRSVRLDLYFSRPHLPSFFTDYHSDLYINIPSTGILVLDGNGTFKTAFNVTGLPDFQILDNDICYYRDHIITRMNMTTLKTKSITVPPEPGIINAHIHKDYLIVHTKQKIIVYSYDENTPPEPY